VSLAAIELEDQVVDVAPLQPPEYDERVLFVGANGTGKTRLEEELLYAGRYRYWTVIDWKGDFHPIGDHARIHLPPWEDKGAWKRDRILYQPQRQDLRTAQAIEAVIGFVFDQAQRAYDYKSGKSRRPRILVVTEAYRLSRARYLQALSDAQVSGRALQLGLWVDSQRPVWIPVELRTEAWRFYTFWLGSTDDEEQVLKYAKGSCTQEDLQRAKQVYSFFEIRRLVDRSGNLQVVARHCPKVALTARSGS
jgi:hypothetical protein